MPLTEKQVQHVITLGWAPAKTYSVSITDVWISKDVQISIGRQLHSLCASYDLPYGIVRDNLEPELFWHEESDQLGLTITVQDSNVDSMYLQVPSGHWGFKEKNVTQ